MILPLLLLAVPVQETSMMMFVQTANNNPPRTRAEAEEIMLNHEMVRVRQGVFIIDVQTTDGAITRAEFHEPMMPQYSQSMFLLTFSGECEPRRAVLGRDKGIKRVGNEWLGRADWGTFAYTFDNSRAECLASYRMTINPVRQPSETG